MPASEQYEQNVSIGIRRRRDIIVFHSAPEIASRWLRVRDMIAVEPFGVYLSSSRTEKRPSDAALCIARDRKRWVCLNPRERRVRSPVQLEVSARLWVSWIRLIASCMIFSGR